MKLTDLEPQFLKVIDNKTYQMVEDIKEADGIDILCPVCFIKNGNSAVGTHHIHCWQPHVSQEHYARPGRWKFEGTGYNDLTLVNGSSSIFLSTGCRAHFWIRNGEIILT
jgi:hypothetical protein